MGEICRDPIDLILDDEPRHGLMLARELLGEYQRQGSLPPAKLSELLKELEACSGANDGCQSCAHQVECARAYDALIGRLK